MLAAKLERFVPAQHKRDRGALLCLPFAEHGNFFLFTLEQRLVFAKMSYCFFKQQQQKTLTAAARRSSAASPLAAPRVGAQFCALFCSCSRRLLLRLHPHRRLLLLLRRLLLKM